MAQDLKALTEAMNRVRRECTTILYVLDRIETNIKETTEGQNVANILGLGLTTKTNLKYLQNAFEGFANVKEVLRGLGERVKGSPRKPRLPERTCTICGITKRIEEFAFNHRARDLRKHQCKTCLCEREKQKALGTYVPQPYRGRPKDIAKARQGLKEVKQWLKQK